MKKFTLILMNKNWQISAALLLVMAWGSGCASIVSKSHWPVMISSSPNDANVSVKNASGVPIMQAKTPTTLLLKSGSGYFCPAEYILEFSKEGCETQSIVLKSSLNGWYFGNIFFGGLIGFLVVDPITGAMYEMPQTAFANLPAKPVEKKPEVPKIEKPVETVEPVDEKLEKLKVLKEKGLITQEEYDGKRKSILNSL